MRRYKQIGTLTSYTTEVVLKEPVLETDLKKAFQERHWLQTWEEVFSNGVIRCDYVSVESGNVLDVDMVPQKGSELIGGLRMLAREEGVLATVTEVIGETEEPMRVHKAEIGVVRREDAPAPLA